MQSVRFPKLRVIAVVCAVLAALVCLGTLGMELPLSPFAAFDLNGPVIADSDGKHTAIVDSGSRRVLILNDKHKLMGTINCDELNSPVEAITNVCVTDDAVYLTGVKYRANSNVIARERVVAYNLFGSSGEVVYDREARSGISPMIKALDSTDEGAYVTLISSPVYTYDQQSVEVHFANKDGARLVKTLPAPQYDIFDMGYCVDQDVLRTISTRGVLDDDYETGTHDADFVAAHAFTSIDVADTGEVYLCDDVTDSVCRLVDDKTIEPIMEGTGFTNPRVSKGTLTVCNIDKDMVVIYDLANQDSLEISEVMPSGPMGTLVLVVFLCRVYLVLFALAFFLARLRSMVAQGRTESLGPMFASVVVVFVVSLAIAYISYGSYTTMREIRAHEIGMLADYVSASSSSIDDHMDRFDNRAVFREGQSSLSESVYDLIVIESQVNTLATSAWQNEIGIYVTAYGQDDQGVFYLFDSSNEHVIGTGVAVSDHERAIQQAFDEDEYDKTMLTGSTRYDETQYQLVRVLSPSDGKVAGVIEVGSRVKSYEASIASDQAQRIIALLVMVLVVYLTYSEIRACAVCFFSYQQMRHHHDSIAILTRPFSFFVTLLSSIDAVMTALIARSLIGSSGMSVSSLLLALPAVMLGLGLAIGQAIYAALGSRVLINKLMTRGALAMTVAAIFTGAVVWYGSFWLYCAAKLAMAIPFGLLYSLSYSLPRRADTEEVRALAAGGIKRTDTSAAALGTVLGGYVAQNLGNAWVYALVAVVGVVVCAMAANLLPATKHPLEEEVGAVGSHKKAMWKLLVSKTTLPVILFVMLPSILCAGYNSFVFPLFSADLGLQTSSINNLFVLGQLVVYVCITTLEYLDDRFDKWRVAGTAIALLGVVFLLFSFNTTLVWAVVTIALVGVLCKASDGWKAMWQRSAEANELPTGLATGMMFSVRSVLLIVQPLLLGALLSESNRTAVIVLGLVCSLCAVAFYYSTRHSALAPER